MATHKIGKLQFDTSKDGLSFSIGDGEKHRLFGRKGAAEDEYTNEDGYEDAQSGDVYEDDYDRRDDGGDDYVASGYSGRFANASSAQDDYDDDGYDDDRYADDDYDDGYDDRDYDDGYADDGGYDDDRGGDYEDDDRYDDRYSDEDAGDYGDDGYSEQSGFMRFVEENDWVTYLLLVVFPPLGIYLLWRRRKFEKPLRYVVSALSALWFIFLLILLFSAIFSGGTDTTTGNTQLTISTPLPTQAVTATHTPEPAAEDAEKGSADGSGTLDDLRPDATPVATAIPSGNGVGGSANTVYMTSTGMYYHNNIACKNIEDATALSSVTTDVAIARGKNACPVCYPNQVVYYATDTGKYYHSDQKCSGMKNASVITADAAKEKGKTACPVCITKEIQSLDKTSLKFATSSTKDKSGITVWATTKGAYYHTNATCSGMKGATSGGLLQAILAGKKACPDCCKGAQRLVYCTEGGKYYHNTSNCSKMKNAYQVMLAEALIIGKKQCTVCWGSKVIDGAVPKNGQAATGNVGSDGTIYVYGTKTGKYYHTNATCSGMQGASRVTLKSMIAAGRAPCPTCCNGASTTVYCTPKGTYYHANATCSGMKGAKATTLASALADGKKRCSTCMPGTTSSSIGSGTYVYCTKKGTYYHTKSNCSGMQNADRVTLATALQQGKKACPTCASAANRKVYSTATGKYYHSKKDCSGMQGATVKTLERAIAQGQTACPKCIGTATASKVTSTGTFKKGKARTTVSKAVTKAKLKKTVTKKLKIKKASTTRVYKPGKSGVKVYATPSGKYYHAFRSCAGKSASRISLETALNYGKKACPKCSAAASKKVYATANGKYYHSNKTCAGRGAVKGTLVKAIAMGKEACPVCIGMKQRISSKVYKPGKSGIKVYATITGKYYHAYRSCAGANASHISLETALNYRKKACPRCASAAKKTVYAVAGKKYYHSSKICAGSGAVSGSFAAAKALGLKECPICIGGSEAYEISDKKYSAPSDTSVYINLNSNMLYYHKKAKCKSAGMTKKGQRVTLGFARKWNYKACPYCNPPTSVSKG